MRYWFHPSWCGDFRLEADTETTCTLTVVDPTPGELDRLGKFLIKSRKKGWVSSPAIGVAPTGTTVLEIRAPVAEAGCVLAGRQSPRGERRGLLTAVRSKAGTLSVATTVEAERRLLGFNHPTPEGDGRPAESGGQVITLHQPNGDPRPEPDSPTEPVAAVTVRRPTLCCPVPIPGPDQRASDVLRAFCTESQWDLWMRQGRLLCEGNLSGHPYEILHRHHPTAHRRGKIAFDLETRRVMHAYDWSVPPAEEALAMMLVLSHREHWIRNRSGYFGPGPRYNNPFMPPDQQSRDGIIDAAIVSSIGMNLRMYLHALGTN